MGEYNFEFYHGVDISFLPQQLDQGMRVYDRDGKETEIFALLKKYGVNAVRLRLWHTPENVKESGGYCNLKHTLQMAEKIRENGMSFLLDFHYSDFWADPANQKKPAAWEGLDRRDLEKAVYVYTRDTLRAFDDQGTLPDMVQIGNEIRSGLLFPEGELPDYQGMTALVNAGIQGARDAAGPDRMKVMLHLDQGGRYDWLKGWFQGAMEQGLLDFDLIGLSYYPFWHGTYMDLKNSMTRLLGDYGKPIFIVENAYAWRRSERGFIDEQQIRLSGLPASPEGQRRELEAVMHLIASLPDHMGKGLYYWEPLCVPEPGQGGWAENMGLLDEQGRVLEGILAFGRSREEMEREPEGFRELIGIQETEETLSAERQGENLLENGDFSEGMAGWRTETKEETAQAYLSPGWEEGKRQPRTLRIQAERNFRFTLSHSVKIPEDGRYSLFVELKGVDTTGVDVRLFVESGGKRWETVIHPAEHAWLVYEVRDAVCSGGEAVVGLQILAPPLYVTVRNFCFVKR